VTSQLDNPESLDVFPDIYFDTNGDGLISAIDALQVINQIIRGGASEPLSPSGESIVIAPTAMLTVPTRETTSLESLRSPQVTTESPAESVEDSVWSDWSDRDAPSPGRAIEEASDADLPELSTLELLSQR
jgi:hypothetical protein